MGDRICSVEGCEEKVIARGWCSRHYRIWKLSMARACERPDCQRPSSSNGLCEAHYAAARRDTAAYAAYLEKRPPCSIDGCGAPTKARALCSRHLYQLRQHGDPHHRLPTREQRFWPNVDRGDKDACWPWLGCCNAQGYGKFAGSGAHRFAWRFANDREIPAGLCVRHTCDNPPCCNPAHLLLGTNLENIADRVRRNRSARGDRSGLRLHPERVARGEHNANSKLTATDVREIRRLYAAGGISQEQLGQRFGVGQSIVSAVIRRQWWRHVP